MSILKILVVLIATLGFAHGEMIINEVGPSSHQSGGFVELYNYGEDFQISGWIVYVGLENGEWISERIAAPEPTDMYLYTVRFPREALSFEGRDWRRVVVYDADGNVKLEQDIPDVYMTSWESYSRIWTGALDDGLKCAGWGIRKATPLETNA